MNCDFFVHRAEGIVNYRVGSAVTAEHDGLGSQYRGEHVARPCIFPPVLNFTICEHERVQITVSSFAVHPCATMNLDDSCGVIFVAEAKEIREARNRHE